RGRGRAAGRLCHGVAQGRHIRPRPGEPDHLDGGDCAQPGDRPAALARRRRPARADRGRRRRQRSSSGRGRARRTGAAAPAAHPLSRGTGRATRERHPGGVPRRRHLRRIGRAHECAARHDEELDSARTVETESLSRTMSDDDTIGPADRGKLIAAEYVLGVLGAEERREVERRLAQEPALASEVAFWEERLGVLADAVAPVTPPQHTWSQIDAAIPAAAAASPTSLGKSLALWRGFGIGAAALAAARMAALAYVGLVPARRAPLMATLAGTSGQPNFVAAVTATGDNLIVVPATLLTSDPRAIELWLILPNQRPRSLGLIPPGQPIRLSSPPDLAGRLPPAPGPPGALDARGWRCRSSRPEDPPPDSPPDRSSPAASSRACKPTALGRRRKISPRSHPRPLCCVSSCASR